MKTLVIQHEADTPPGSTLLWLQEKKIPYSILDAQTGLFPDPKLYENVIVCGGSMNVDEENLHPWLKPEKLFLESCLSDGKKILGLCLGAQLLAEILGARVESMHNWEIGWHPVYLEETKLSPFFFHWHGYHFTLPQGAQRLGKSEICANQGFEWKSTVTGYQFHPEADQAWIDLALQDYSSSSTATVQSKQQIQQSTAQYLSHAQAWYFHQLNKKFTCQKL